VRVDVLVAIPTVDVLTGVIVAVVDAVDVAVGVGPLIRIPVERQTGTIASPSSTASSQSRLMSEVGPGNSARNVTVANTPFPVGPGMATPAEPHPYRMLCS
jgi:hypothetical protein